MRSDDHADLRETLFEELGDAKDPAVLAEAESMTKQLFSGQKVADPVLADAAVALATVKGDTEMYEKLLRVSENTSDPDLKEAALRALTRFEAPELVIRTLLYAVSDEVRNQDTWMLIAPLLARRDDAGPGVGVRPAALGGDRAQGDGELGAADCGGGGIVLHGGAARRGGQFLSRA